ncbi:MAG TPA: polyphosphate kinase 1 [Spirochaetota bacterium]|mgnify:CR=1 FL=1|nr:polyphosphate kinase 1 [Spirochaetota bacterium]HQE58167.1 polyphosphate kinase 1 [Spirochaetota bacterium]
MKDYRPKEISWISFNARVLQEANDSAVPLMQRIKFLGIYSSNLDEFFEIKVATLNRFAPLGKKAYPLIGGDPKKILAEIQDIMWTRHLEFDTCFSNIITELEKRNVFFMNENNLNEEQKRFIRIFFNETVRPKIFPVMLGKNIVLPPLRDRSVYLMVKLSNSIEKKDQYSLIEVPSGLIPRFIVLPRDGEKKCVIFLDDVIRFGLSDIFSPFGYDKFEAYDIKMTRDAELDLGDDLGESLLNKVSKSLKKRHSGAPVRISYDSTVPEEMLSYFLKKMNLKRNETFVPGGRYHNFKDFMRFPNILPSEDSDIRREPIIHRELLSESSIISVIRKRDVMLHFPYNSFNMIIDLLREASMDTNVSEIKITLYRVAKDSSIANALINASKNGKKVTVLMEIQARFDEDNNIYWANLMKEEGVKVILGIAGLKVHSKLCMITRRENNAFKNYCIIGTGNFNEETARQYTDHYLLTSDKRITSEISELFNFFVMNFRHHSYRNLLVAPFNMRDEFKRLIKNEIRNAESGVDAEIFIKVNNLVDREMIKYIRRAAESGVRVRLLIRGMFSLVLNSSTVNIEARGLIDRYLEHSRVYFFANGGNELCYISSADLMSRNLDNRIEVAVPIYDSSIRNELREILEISWKDNVKSRILDESLSNKYYRGGEVITRSQDEIYGYLKEKHGS